MSASARVKSTIYRHVADHASMPTVEQVGARLRMSRAAVLAAYADLAAHRMLVLEQDGETLRMASPFSGRPTQHFVEADCKTYYANCAWDALGVAAALGTDGLVSSRCEQTLEPLRIEVRSGEAPNLETCSEWRFHTPVAAGHWWDDIVFT